MVGSLAGTEPIRHAGPTVMPMRAHAGLAFGACVVAVLSCGDPPKSDPPCVTLKTDCQPFFDPPTYPTIYNKILQPTCATGTGTCHTPDSRKAGLYFQDAAQAYRLLIGMEDGRARVLPNNPGCSIL